jgi:hypothetical protein
MSNNGGKITRIIACSVFKPALEHVGVGERYPELRLTYLPSNLHLRPQELKSLLLKKIASAQKSNERVICLYGDCFPGIDDFCQQQRVVKVPGHSCYEMLLGSERFRQLLEEIAGTYFLEKELILNFEEYCIKPLELNDEEMRKCYFERYQRLLYVRQPSDPDLVQRAGELAAFLDLSLEIIDADYPQFQEKIIKLLRLRQEY